MCIISNINEFVDDEWLFKENKCVHKIRNYTQFLDKKFLIEIYKYNNKITQKRKKYVLVTWFIYLLYIFTQTCDFISIKKNII